MDEGKLRERVRAGEHPEGRRRHQLAKVLHRKCLLPFRSNQERLVPLVHHPREKASSAGPFC